MAFLDFVKNRQDQQSAQQTEQKPETAKAMYTREDAEGRAAQKPIQQLSDADRSQSKELGARLDKATQHIQQDTQPGAAAPADGTGSPEPMRQKMTAQDKAAPSLSPTSGQMGTPASEKDATQPSQESPKPEAVKAPSMPQHSRGGWER
jgi:hypothetical protein